MTSTAPTLTPGTRVIIQHAPSVGTSLGTIVRPRKSELPTMGDWLLVRMDGSGVLRFHKNALQVAS